MKRPLIMEGFLGSHLHGTANENSDTDLIQVVLPFKKEIIFGIDPTKNKTTSRSDVKNDSTDVDIKMVSLMKFIKDCLRGDLYTFDALQSGGNHPLWNTIFSKREQLYLVNLHAADGLYHKAKGDIIRFDYCGKSVAHAIRVMEIMRQIIRDDDFSYPLKCNSLLIDIKSGEINKNGLNNYLDFYRDLLGKDYHQAVLSGDWHFNSEIRNKTIDAWNHWVYSVYLEIVRGQRK